MGYLNLSLFMHFNQPLKIQGPNLHANLCSHIESIFNNAFLICSWASTYTSVSACLVIPGRNQLCRKRGVKATVLRAWGPTPWETRTQHFVRWFPIISSKISVMDSRQETKEEDWRTALAHTQHGRAFALSPPHSHPHLLQELEPLSCGGCPREFRSLHPPWSRNDHAVCHPLIGNITVYIP
jgi:hypothetical protein